jgi:hypothetical protein
MEILHGLRLLQSPTTSYFEPRDISDEKVAVLKLIGEEGNPGIAGSLIPFLKDESRPVRAATCQAIEQLFARIRRKVPIIMR